MWTYGIIVYKNTHTHIHKQSFTENTKLFKLSLAKHSTPRNCRDRVRPAAPAMEVRLQAKWYYGPWLY